MQRDVAQPIWLSGCPKQDLFCYKEVFFLDSLTTIWVEPHRWDRWDSNFYDYRGFQPKTTHPKHSCGGVYVNFKKLLNIVDLWHHISGPHITFWTFSAVSGVYHAWGSFNNYGDKKRRKGLVESLCMVTWQRERIRDVDGISRSRNISGYPGIKKSWD